ncbi:MAG: DUF350 domain-containing protein [Flavobacteriaceae bacterium]|nr:DUF350 domain-containing protein [Flavobacteriaceae bacterium]
MNSTLFNLAVIQIIISVLIAVSVLFISFKILRKIFFNNSIDQENHLAFTIFTSGLFVSIGMILSEIIPSISNIIRLSIQDANELTFTSIILYSGIYLVVGFLFAVIINLATFLLFTGMTRGLNEFNEIKNNNSAIAILVVSTIISITLIIKDSISSLIESLIPYEQVSNFLL